MKIAITKDYDDPQGGVATYEVLLDGQVVGSMEKSSSWNGERYAADYYCGTIDAVDGGDDYTVAVEVAYQCDARQALTRCKAALREYVKTHAAALRNEGN
jgi:hypothetical protein